MSHTTPPRSPNASRNFHGARSQPCPSPGEPGQAAHPTPGTANKLGRRKRLIPAAPTARPVESAQRWEGQRPPALRLHPQHRPCAESPALPERSAAPRPCLRLRLHGFHAGGCSGSHPPSKTQLFLALDEQPYLLSLSLKRLEIVGDILQLLLQLGTFTAGFCKERGEKTGKEEAGGKDRRDKK